MAVASAAPSPPHVLQPPPASQSHTFALVCWSPHPGPRSHGHPAHPAHPVAPPEERDSWLAACYRLTPRLERLDATHALLDLGVCTVAEARAAVGSLLCHLDTLHPPSVPDTHDMLDMPSSPATRIGLGPSPLLAQLALLAATTRGAAPNDRIAVIAPDTVPDVLRTLPVRLLPRLHPRGAIAIETVERLERYGLRTLGQIARLGEPALRRQFGDRLGAMLSALAAGREILPLIPTSQPPTRRFRLPFAPAAAPERALAALPALARWIAQHLAAEQLQAGALRLLLVWESGATRSAQTRPRTPIHAAAPLAGQLQQLTLTLAGAEGAPRPDDVDDVAAPRWATPPGEPPRIARIVVELADLRPRIETQGAFWETPARKHAALGELADTLARRYPRAPLLRAVCVRPHAIFRAERYELRPLGDAADADAGHADHAAGALSAPSVRRGEPAADPWDGVPHRLHWW